MLIHLEAPSIVVCNLGGEVHKLENYDKAVNYKVINGERRKSVQRGDLIRRYDNAKEPTYTKPYCLMAC